MTTWSSIIEIQPKGFKYIVTTTVTENLGQGGRADMACHWEDSDTVAQEMWMNVSPLQDSDCHRCLCSYWVTLMIGLHDLYLPRVCDPEPMTRSAFATLELDVPPHEIPNNSAIYQLENNIKRDNRPF